MMKLLKIWKTFDILLRKELHLFKHSDKNMNKKLKRKNLNYRSYLRIYWIRLSITKDCKKIIILI